RVTRLCLKGRFDRLQAGVGLQDMGWGQGWFYRPTDYFEPLGPLAFWREEPLGSESLDLSQPLFDELVLEAAARATAGGGDWVVRLPNETLAYALTPSLARLGGRMVLGLEARLTLPVCQLRLEGARWDGGDSPLEMEAGLSTRWDGSDLCLEWLRDATGEALGEFSGAAPGADYLYFSWGRALGPAWRLETRLVKSPDGGPFLLWPKAVMDFGTGWQFSLEGRTLVAWSAGPLARVGARLFTALAWEF
ncbi:MAG TPA: hypothetical protein VFR02_07225, partial [bacterium]|nr:hypothetical protein [bacterium]